MSGGHGGYYASLAREDYYTTGGEPPGQWLGEGAKKLGLAGKVVRSEFLEVFAGFLDGKKLVQSAGKENHRPGWDLTFSAPKSVSTLWSQADREMGLEIRAAHLSAVEKAVEYLEKSALWTRRGQGGREAERCGAVFATFEHGTSRAQDPQIHTHALLLNIGVRDDGSTGTLETKAVFTHKMAAGALYRAELGRQLERRLGVEVEREKSWFEVKGVSEKLTDEFSQRRRAIEEALAKEGRSGPVASAVAALDTRDKKAHIPREELLEKWQAVGKQMGWGVEQANALDRGPQPERRQADELPKAGQKVVEKLMEQNSFFSKVQLTRHLAEEAQTLGVGADAVLTQVETTLRDKEIRALGLRFGEPVYTTAEMLKLEQAFLKKVEEASSRCWFSVWDQHLKPVVERHTLNEEQIRALKTVTQGESSIAAIVGMAGTGKTTLLKAAREAWESAGYEVVGAALAGKAARGLEEGAGIKSATIAKTLRDLESSTPDLTRFKVKTVLVIDEAGMVGTRQMDKLLSYAQAAGAKIVLVGDPHQLQPIEAGGPFAAIIERVKERANLTTIVRQREEWQRKAVKDFSSGKAREALKEFADRGLLNVAEDRQAARVALMEAWKVNGMHTPRENLIIAAMNADVTILNREAQALRLHQRFLHGSAVEVSGEKIYAGDQVVFTKRFKALGVENGSLGWVKEVGLGGKIRVELASGEEREFSTKHFQDLKLGYAVTTHRAQGVTSENTFVLTCEQMQDLHVSYVQASRARGETRMFTTLAECGEELKDLSKRMEASHPKTLATDAARAMNLEAASAFKEKPPGRTDSQRALDPDLEAIQQKWRQTLLQRQTDLERGQQHQEIKM